MRAKSMILIVIALGCGLIASIGISQVMERRSDDGPQVVTTPVLVASTDIDIGEAFTAENVTLEQWPNDRVPPQAISDIKQLEGRYPRMRMYSGEAILTAKLLTGDLGSPSTTIPAGYRVASVKVSVDTAVSGLVLPGDRVDIIAFLKQSSEVPRTLTRTILRDVRVFAVDSKTERELDPEGNPAGMAKTVSVLVKRDQIEPLMLALELGKLRLSLRRPNEVDESIVANEATVDSILGRPAERADDKRQEGEAEPFSTQQFLTLINAPPQNEPPADAFHEMVVLSPNGQSRFRWDSEASDPHEVYPGDSAAGDSAAGEPRAASGRDEASLHDEELDRSDSIDPATPALPDQSRSAPRSENSPRDFESFR